MIRFFPLLLALASAGCVFQNMQMTERLQDQVYALNDETRWGRIDLAAQRVVPAYRSRFLELHQGWGTSVQVAETELTNLALAEDGQSAAALVTVSWYDMQSMEAHTTHLRQRWTKSDGPFALAGEEIVGGEPSLFESSEGGGEVEPDDGISPLAAR